MLIFGISLNLFLTGCTQDYTVHQIPYTGDPYPLKTLVIISKTELIEYFSQEDYVTKGENYEKTTSKFNDEFFSTRALIPILYSENYTIKGVKSESGIVKVRLKIKNGPRPEVMKSLYFLEVQKKDIGNAKQVIIVNE